MNKPEIPPRLSVKRLAWSAVSLCAGCCAVIPLLVLFGVTGVASLGRYFEFAATGFFFASLILFGYLIIKNKKLICKLNCSCKDPSA